MPTFLHHHLHHGHPDEFTQILRSRNLRAFGFGIARTFVPLYLITVYGGLREAMLPITVFVLATWPLRALLMLFYSRLIIRWGAKHAMSLSFVAGAISLLMTAYLQPSLWWIAGLGFMLGLGNGLFFTSYHTDLALTLKRTDAVKHGVGSVEMVRKVVLALGPLIGGVVATRVSEQALFLFAGAIMASAMAALYLKEDDVISHKTKLNVLDGELFKEHWRDFVANIAMSFNTSAASFIWPILLFVVIGTYEAVGFVLAVSLVLSLVIITVVRRRESADSDRKEIATASNATAIVHIARPFVDTASMAAGVNFFNDLAFSLLYVPYVDRYYKHIRKKDSMSYVTVMEMSSMTGHTVIWLSFVGLYLVASQTGAFLSVFLMAALAVLFVRLISRD